MFPPGKLLGNGVGEGKRKDYFYPGLVTAGSGQELLNFPLESHLSYSAKCQDRTSFALVPRPILTQLYLCVHVGLRDSCFRPLSVEAQNLVTSHLPFTHSVTLSSGTQSLPPLTVQVSLASLEMYISQTFHLVSKCQPLPRPLASLQGQKTHWLFLCFICP